MAAPSACSSNTINQCQRVSRRRIAAPGHMAVGPHQHEAALVEQADRWVTDGLDRQWNSAACECVRDRGRVRRVVAEAHEREAATIEVDDRAAVAKPGVRGAAAGHRVGVIVLDRGMRGGVRFVPADRGGVVTISERKTVGDELASHARHDGIAHLAARAFTLGSILKDLRRWLTLAVALMAHVGVADVAAPDRLALDLVALEQSRAAPAGECGGKLPAEIDRIS